MRRWRLVRSRAESQDPELPARNLPSNHQRRVSTARCLGGGAAIAPRGLSGGAMATEGSPQATVLFADLAGFSALTEAHGDLDAADLAARFYALAQAALAEGARVV